MQAAAKNKFSPGAEGPARRSHVGLDFDQQTIATIDGWARGRGLSFAAVMDQAARQIAGSILRDPFFAAQQLRFDRSIQEDLDLDLSGFSDQISLEKKIDRSIPASGRFSCGNLKACEAEKARAELRFAGAEGERAKEVLAYYRALTGNHLTPGDARAVARVAQFSDLTIQAGILQALNYSTRPIGSFAYCVKAIENFSDHNSAELQAAVMALIDKLLAKRKRGQIALPLAGEKLLIGEFNQED